MEDVVVRKRTFFLFHMTRFWDLNPRRGKKLVLFKVIIRPALSRYWGANFRANFRAKFVPKQSVFLRYLQIIFLLTELNQTALNFRANFNLHFRANFNFPHFQILFTRYNLNFFKFCHCRFCIVLCVVCVGGQLEHVSGVRSEICSEICKQPPRNWPKSGRLIANYSRIIIRRRTDGNSQLKFDWNLLQNILIERA